MYILKVRYIKYFFFFYENNILKKTKLTVITEVHLCNLAISPLKIFIKTVSAMSSALWPVAIQSTPKRAAPRSNACLRNTPQNVQLFFLPI